MRAGPILSVHSIGILGALALFLASGLAGCTPQISLETNEFQIASSSMAPGLRGPSIAAQCRACSNTYYVAAETCNPGLRTRCFVCGGECDLAREPVPGEVVSVSLNVSESVKRFDRIVFHDAFHPDVRQVKRVWGLAEESIRFFEGDLWINDVRFQKTLLQLRRVAIPMVRLQSTQPIPPNSVFNWQYVRPAPVAVGDSPPEAWMVPSEIVNDYEHNQGLSHRLYPVNDFLVSFELADALTNPIEIQLHYRNQPVLVSLCPSHDYTDQHEHEFTRVPCSKRITLALCDGQLLIEADQFHKTVAFDKRDLARISAADLPPTPQVVIRTGQQTIEIKNFEVQRDQFLLRSDDTTGPEEFGEVPQDSLFVLGDNLAASVDSRHEPGFLQLKQVLGIIPE